VAGEGNAIDGSLVNFLCRETVGRPIMNMVETRKVFQTFLCVGHRNRDLWLLNDLSVLLQPVLTLVCEVLCPGLHPGMPYKWNAGVIELLKISGDSFLTFKRYRGFIKQATAVKPLNDAP
jgi:hypothetical protein